MIASHPATTGQPIAAAARQAVASDAAAGRGRAEGSGDFDVALSRAERRMPRPERAAGGGGDKREAEVAGATGPAVAADVPATIPAVAADVPAPVTPEALVVAAGAVEPAASAVAEAIAAVPVVRAGAASPAVAAVASEPDAAKEAVAGQASDVGGPVSSAGPVAASGSGTARVARERAGAEADDGLAIGDRPADVPVARHAGVLAAAGAPAAGLGQQPSAVVAPDAVGSGLVALPDVAPIGWQLAPGPALPVRGDGTVAAVPLAGASPQAVIGQLAVAVGKANDRRVEIRLDPPELGRVQIHLTPIDGGVQAVVLADRPETQDLLRRHADGLARELGAAGYGSVSLDFAAGHGAAPGRDGGRDEGRGGERPPVAVAFVEAAPVAVAGRPPGGGLDVRL